MLLPARKTAPVIPALLTVDNEVVVPVGETVRLLVTASDVIHSWTIPAFGVKMDAVPGRINETWFKADKEGLYYGQCSELCGKDHGFMPIAVRVVSKDQYQNWLSAAATDLPGQTRLFCRLKAKAVRTIRWLRRGCKSRWSAARRLMRAMAF